MTGGNRTRPKATVTFVETAREVPRPGMFCQIGVDINVNDQILSAYLHRAPTSLILDLIRLVAAVAHVDRRLPRRPSVCWGRDLHLRLPMSDPAFWSAPKRVDELSCLLGALTGDKWSSSFRARSRVGIRSEVRV